MAVHRPQEGCPICGEPFKAITRPDNPNNPVVGDNFIRWDYEGHRCNREMKYLFLDIDGVIANDWSVKQPNDKWLKVDNDTAYPFFPAAVEQLNRLIVETGADIILSSDWRISFNLKQLDYIFKANEVIKSPVAVTEHLTEYWNTKMNSIVNMSVILKLKNMLLKITSNCLQ
jgi:hypothetical protein